MRDAPARSSRRTAPFGCSSARTSDPSTRTPSAVAATRCSPPKASRSSSVRSLMSAAPVLEACPGIGGRRLAVNRLASPWRGHRLRSAIAAAAMAASGGFAGAVSSARRSSRNEVCAAPRSTSGCWSTRSRNGMFVRMPRIGKARSAATARCSAAARVSAGGHELGEHRVVVDADLVPLDDAGVDADARSRRFAVEQERAGLGQEVRRGILRIDPALDGVAALTRATPASTAAARRRRPPAALSPDRRRSPLPSPDARPAAGCSSRGSRTAHRLPRLRAGTRSCRRCGSRRPCAAAIAAAPMRSRTAGASAGDGTLFDDLLMAALQRALALEEVHDIAVVVAEHLQLDVTRPFDQLLDVQRAVAECGRRLAPRRRNQLRRVVLVPHDAHAPSAAACRGLDEDWKADAPRPRPRCRGRSDRPASGPERSARRRPPSARARRSSTPCARSHRPADR